MAGKTRVAASHAFEPRGGGGTRSNGWRSAGQTCRRKVSRSGRTARPSPAEVGVEPTATPLSRGSEEARRRGGEARRRGEATAARRGGSPRRLAAAARRGGRRAAGTCETKAACKFSKILLFSLWDPARKMRLVKSFRFFGSNREKVHWASSCGRFIARKEFWSQCHILLLDTTQKLLKCVEFREATSDLLEASLQEALGSMQRPSGSPGSD